MSTVVNDRFYQGQTVLTEAQYEEAERLLSYWEQHGETPEAVARWAVVDMLGFLRLILGGESR